MEEQGYMQFLISLEDLNTEQLKEVQAWCENRIKEREGLDEKKI